MLAGTLAGVPTAAWSLTRKVLAFPRDAGAHPAFATEWWYLTGYANVAGEQAALGFQVTFFRSRVDATQGMQSRLAARQLLFAHAAVTDVRGNCGTTSIARWSGEPAGAIRPIPPLPARRTLASGCATGHCGTLVQTQAQIPATDFTLNLTFKATQPCCCKALVCHARARRSSPATTACRNCR